jgi:hypothetical protein
LELSTYEMGRETPNSKGRTDVEQLPLPAFRTQLVGHAQETGLQTAVQSSFQKLEILGVLEEPEESEERMVPWMPRDPAEPVRREKPCGFEEPGKSEERESGWTEESWEPLEPLEVSEEVSQAPGKAHAVMLAAALALVPESFLVTVAACAPELEPAGEP